VSEIKETDWAYAAGFVDGEGCIAITREYVAKRRRFYYGVAVVVANRDRSVLDWMHSLWGGWVVVAPSRGNSRAACNWRSPSGLGAATFLEGVGEYLRIKMPQCENALAMIALMRRSFRTLGPNPMPQKWIEEQEALYWKQRELNHRGNAKFVKEPMHSPRLISRSLSTVAQQKETGQAV
jgi:hypothetical protein